MAENPDPQLALAAQRRLFGTVQEQAETEDAVRRKRPLEAEPLEERALAYIQNLVGVNRELALRILRYEDPKTLPIADVQRSAAESLQGNTVDFLPVAFLDLARAAANSVARVVFPDGSPQGTGFLVSPRLFLTNYHVIPSPEEASSFRLEFQYELDAQRQQVEVTRFALDPGLFFEADPEDDLDFSLVAVGQRLEGPRTLADFGFIPLSDDPDKHVVGGRVNIVQHPQGRHKEIVVRENLILARTETTLIYGADTLPGSSGGLVANDRWEAVALHHYGSPFRALHDQSAGLPAVGNEGIRISAILADLRARLPALAAARSDLLQEVLSPFTSQPVLVPSRSSGEASRQAPPALPGTAVEVDPDRAATWTVPLTVSVRLGP